jgi:ABC-type dipeptide/oligopeptide/nickel transport system ATPase component
MLIIEGPDGSGKSIIAQRLMYLLKRECFHEGGPVITRPDAIGRLDRQFDRFGSILDRVTFVSERVYGPILRGKMALDEATLDLYEKRFIDAGWMLVYCRPSDEAIIGYVRGGRMDKVIIELGKEYKTRNHVQGIKDNIEAIIASYDRVVASLRKKGMMVMTYVRD